MQRKRLLGCWGGLSCFRTQKGGKRIVPASRTPEGSNTATQQNRHEAVGSNNQNTAFVPSLLAPPSSPTSFTNSAIPSTVQSPNCYLSLSANSPGGPSSTMFATGPYAHETQLVSPPVFSTYTTEPSTAPLTPPPELAHLTTPSSPDVPYAQFLSLVSRTSDECLSSSFQEPKSSHKCDSSVSPQNGKHSRTGSGRGFGRSTATASMFSQDSNFFCPATSPQFYLDHTQQSYPPSSQSGGRLSLSRESDGYSGSGNGHQNKHSKQDEEVEAYRASFGFSADEIISTSQYVEISDVHDDSFTINPLASSRQLMEEHMDPTSVNAGQKLQVRQADLPCNENLKPEPERVNEGVSHEMRTFYNDHEDLDPQRQSGVVCRSNLSGNHIERDEDDIFSQMGAPRFNRKYLLGSSSDAEVDYRRLRS